MHERSLRRRDLGSGQLVQPSRLPDRKRGACRDGRTKRRLRTREPGTVACEQPCTSPDVRLDDRWSGALPAAGENVLTCPRPCGATQDRGRADFDSVPR